MNYNFELCEVELLKENFERIVPPLETITKVNNNMKKGYRLGIAQNNDDANDMKIVLQYDVELEQINDNSEKISKLSLQYLFVFNDEEKKIIELISKEDVSDEAYKEIVSELDRIAYPYIKEHLEIKYKKANLPINLLPDLTNKEKKR